jgi:hypothetical protein
LIEINDGGAAQAAPVASRYSPQFAAPSFAEKHDLDQRRRAVVVNDIS